MAYYTTGYSLGLTKQQFIACECIFNGMNATDAAKHTFDCTYKDGRDGYDEKLVKRYSAKIREWTRDDKFKEAYRELMRELAYSYVGKSVQRIASQMDDKNGWLVNKAAIDILNRFYGAVMGEDDTAVHIKIEGMPELGEPDAE